jgi:SHS2 domain-containing protein
MSVMGPYRLLDHTADLGLEISAPSLPGLYAEAGRALMAVLFEGNAPRQADQAQTLTVTGTDPVDLLVNFLGELLYLAMFKAQALVDIELFEIMETELSAIVHLSVLDFDRTPPLAEIKAVTYHQAAVEQTLDGWRARVIFDV